MQHILILAAGLAIFAANAPAQERNIPKDLSKVRGFNYQSAPTIRHAEHWLDYDPAETERDMDYARRLNLNQVRACHQRGIGVMPTLQYPAAWSQDRASWHFAEEWAADLVETIGKEPGLAFWDAHNEPRAARLEFAKHMAGVLRELDKRTPVTVGTTVESEMETLGADAVDILVFHDYSATRGQIRANIERARQLSLIHI